MHKFLQIVAQQPLFVIILQLMEVPMVLVLMILTVLLVADVWNEQLRVQSNPTLLGIDLG